MSYPWPRTWWRWFARYWVTGSPLGVIGVRQALDFSTGKAGLTVLIGWIIYVVLNIVVTTGSAGVFGLLG